MTFQWCRPRAFAFNPIRTSKSKVSYKQACDAIIISHSHSPHAHSNDRILSDSAIGQETFYEVIRVSRNILHFRSANVSNMRIVLNHRIGICVFFVSLPSWDFLYGCHHQPRSTIITRIHMWRFADVPCCCCCCCWVFFFVVLDVRKHQSSAPIALLT